MAPFLKMLTYYLNHLCAKSYSLVWSLTILLTFHYKLLDYLCILWIPGSSLSSSRTLRCPLPIPSTSEESRWRSSLGRGEPPESHCLSRVSFRSSSLMRDEGGDFLIGRHLCCLQFQMSMSHGKIVVLWKTANLCKMVGWMQELCELDPSPSESRDIGALSVERRYAGNQQTIFFFFFFSVTDW